MGLIDITGQKFGRLTVIGFHKRKKHYNYIWECKCDCGNTSYISSGALKSGKTKSCGCLQKEKMSQNRQRNLFILAKTYGIGITTDNRIFYFDLEDYDKIKDHCWSFRGDYLVANINNRPVLMHRFMLGLIDRRQFVDHINHKGYDNRRSNLRVCTNSQNNFNRKLEKTNTSGIKGVSFNKKTNKWFAYIGVNNKRIRLGNYVNLKDAVDARLTAEEKYFGEFAYKYDIKGNIF